MNSRIISCDDPLWNECLSMMPLDKQDVYYTAEYHKAYDLNGDGKPQMFVFESKGDIGIYPFLLNPIPDYEFDCQYYDIQSVYGYSGPLASTDNRDFCNEFECSFLEYVKSANIIAEFVRFHPLIQNHEVFSNNIEVIPDRQTVVLGLHDDIEDIQNYQFSSNGRRGIRLAKKNGLTSVISKDSSAFIVIYRKTMTRLHADDYYHFNECYFSKITSMSSSFFLDICTETRVVASAIIFVFKDYCHYHLSGSDKDFLFCYPSNLLLLEAIKFAKMNECKTFHFGGGRTSNQDDSLLHFKSNFSKSRATYYVGKRILNVNVYRTLMGKWESINKRKATKLLEYRD